MRIRRIEQQDAFKTVCKPDDLLSADAQAYALLVYPDCRRAGNDLLPVVREARD